MSSSSRCAATNGPILEELAALRHERATLLGFPSHAAFMLAPKMAATPAAATALLSDVRSRLAPLRKEELARLKEIKAEREGLAGGKANGAGPPDGGSSAVKLDEWDTAFYVRLLKERDYSIDQEEVRQYFPLPRVKRQIFSLFEKLLHVKIRRVVKPSTGGEAMAADEDEDEEGDAEEGELPLGRWWVTSSSTCTRDQGSTVTSASSRSPRPSLATPPARLPPALPRRVRRVRRVKRVKRVKRVRQMQQCGCGRRAPSWAT